MDAWLRGAALAGPTVFVLLAWFSSVHAQSTAPSLAPPPGTQRPGAEEVSTAHDLLRGLGEDATGPDDASSDEDADAEEPPAWMDFRAVTRFTAERRGSLPPPARRDRPFVVPENLRIDSAQRYFVTRQRAALEAGYRRAGRYLPLIRSVLAEEGLPPQLAYLAAVESNFDPFARSSANAVGLWQFMADTARRYGLRVALPWYDERLDPVYSTRAAARLLAGLYDRFGSWDLALAAYNAGDGRIRRAIRKAGQAPGGQDYWSLRRLPRETKGYVPAFYALHRIYDRPWSHGLLGAEQEPPLQLEAVMLDFPASLADLAQRLEIPAHLLRGLNPAWRRGFIPPTSREPVLLHVPAGQGKRVAGVLAATPPEQLRWRTHKVAKGETLAEIARGYGVVEREVIELNRLRAPGRPAIGHELILPLAAPSAPARTVESVSEGVRAVHRVRNGETLAAIAQLYGVSQGNLRRWNDIAEGVAPGLELVVLLPR